MKIIKWENFNEYNHYKSDYIRVIPRDLFNESKLLKCLGRLCLLIHEGKIDIKFDHDESPFNIVQNVDGDIYVSNIEFSINGNKLNFSTMINNKDNYPLICDEEFDFTVFDESGNFTPKFLEYLDVKRNMEPEEE